MIISIFGDFVCQNPEHTKVGESLKDLLSDSDFNVINFEAPVKKKDAVPIHKSGPNIYQPAASIKWLENNHFNIISLANNHLLDFGTATAELTKHSFNNVYTFGLGEINDAYKALVIQRQNIKIGLIALTHHEFSCVEDYGYGCAWMGSPKVIQEIIKCRAEVDYLIIYNHGGLEYFDQPLPQYRDLYKSWIDFGTDAVLASHPHVPQGWEIYKNKPIFYSLGNFLFEMNNAFYPPRWNNSLGVRLEIKDNKLSFKVIPILYNPEARIVDVDTSSSSDEILNKLNDILNSPEKYDKAIKDKMSQLIKLYDGMLIAGKYSKIGFNIPYLKAIAKYILRWPQDSIHHLNLYRCETHRWVMEYLLSNNLL